MKTIRLLARLAVAIVLGAAPARAAVDSPRITSDRWPSMYTIEDFARDIIRLENARTGEEKERCEAIVLDVSDLVQEILEENNRIEVDKPVATK